MDQDPMTRVMRFLHRLDQGQLSALADNMEKIGHMGFVEAVNLASSPAPPQMAPQEQQQQKKQEQPQEPVSMPPMPQDAPFEKPLPSGAKHLPQALEGAPAAAVPGQKSGPGPLMQQWLREQQGK